MATEKNWLITKENPINMTTMGVGFLGGMLKRGCCVIGVHDRVGKMNSQTCFQHNPHNEGKCWTQLPLSLSQ